MRFKTISKLFERGNCCVYGERGSGKDLITANHYCKRKKPYSSNIDYGGNYIPLSFADLNINNSFDNFISGNINYYKCPLPDYCDIIISDCGVYLPSQYNSVLDKRYPYLPMYFALSRQLNLANCHISTQALNRPWIKLKEQSSTFILCRDTLYVPFINLCFTWVTIYDKFESAEQKRNPLAIRPSIFMKRESRANIKLKLAEYEAEHGKIKRGLLIYFNRSKYDTRHFKKLLLNGIKDGD